MTRLGALPPAVDAPLPAAVGRAWVDRLAAVECPAFTARRARRGERAGAPHDPIVWVEAAGANVRDADGNVYVDLTSGFGAAAVGHGHPAVVAALRAQSGRLVHALGDLHPSDVKITLLERLVALAPFAGGRAMLALGGADAVEAALKTAALATGRPGLVAFDGGYHGLSHGPLAVCGYGEAFRAPFAEQLNPHVRFCPWPAADAPLDGALAPVERALAEAPVGAVVVEPIQGRGGVRVPPAGFLRGLHALTRRHGALLVVDEIFTGLGRCGRRWQLLADASEGSGGSEGEDVEGAPVDLLCVGKALGGGLPVSECVGRPEVMGAWGDPRGAALHTGTFFGDPLGAAAALATLDVLEGERLATRAAEVGARFRERLARVCGDRVVQVRGAGLLAGVELASTGRTLRLVRRLLERGYLTLPAGADARVLQLVPPLTIDEPLLDAFTDALGEALDEEPARAEAGA